MKYGEEKWRGQIEAGLRGRCFLAWRIPGNISVCFFNWVLKGGVFKGRVNWGTLRIPREDWGTLGNNRE